MEILRNIWNTAAVGEHASYGRALALLVAGFVLSRLVKRIVRRWRLRSQHLALLQRFAGTIVLAVFVGWALAELGLELGYLLGAAGVLTLAIGFASQTSVSNLISGIFLMSEKPFVVGDIIEVDTKTGEVISIDLLSVRLRTFQNLMVRIPNETMLKSNVTNLSHFPIRRIDIKVGVAYGSDLEQVRTTLEGVVGDNPLCLQEPEAKMMFLGFGDSSLNLQLSVWASQANWFEVQNTIPVDIARAFARENITIPFPQRTVHLPAGERST